MIKLIDTDSINSNEISLYNERSETLLYRANEPKPGFFVAESAKIVLRALEDEYIPVSLLVEDTIIKNYRSSSSSDNNDNNKMLQIVDGFDFEVPVYVLPHKEMISTTGYNITGGVLSLMNRRNNIDCRSLIEKISAKDRSRIVVLDDVENPTNVGAIIRCAAALGADCVLITSSSSDPLYRRSARVSMGTVFQIPWAIVRKGEDYVNLLHQFNFKIASMALKDDSVDIDDYSLNAQNHLAIVMGNEGNGLSDEVINNSDYTVCIPMSHGVDSLNVAAASAVAIWQLCR